MIPGIFYPYQANIETTRITWHDPPAVVPGMTGVHLSAEGRLLDFYAITSQGNAPAERPPDWFAWFEKAGLKFTDFRPTTEHAWVPPVFADTRHT